MAPAVEPLEPRDCPSALALVRNGTRAGDVEQGRAADCTFLALLASSAQQGHDLLSRLHRVAPGQWRVGLFTAAGTPTSVPVRFTGAVTPLDPELKGGEFWPLLFARANRRLNPCVATGGQSAEVAGGTLFGRLPEDDRSVRAVGLEGVRSALERGSAVVCYSAYHAYAALGVTDAVVTLYDPWGFVRRMPAAAFLRKPFDVAIMGEG
jgi:hypothetical protein